MFRIKYEYYIINYKTDITKVKCLSTGILINADKRFTKGEARSPLNHLTSEPTALPVFRRTQVASVSITSA